MIENSKVDLLAKNLHNEAKLMFECMKEEMKNAAEYSGMELVSLETGVKPLSSIETKLRNIGMNFNDLVRFTMVAEADEYYNSVRKLGNYLNNGAFYFKRSRNAWLEHRNTYVGLNLDVQYGKYVFEIQVHTKESLDFRNGEDHRRYKQISNDHNMSFLEIQELQLKSFKESSCIKVPNNVNKINILEMREF